MGIEKLVSPLCCYRRGREVGGHTTTLTARPGHLMTKKEDFERTNLDSNTHPETAQSSQDKPLRAILPVIQNQHTRADLAQSQELSTGHQFKFPIWRKYPPSPVSSLGHVNHPKPREMLSRHETAFKHNHVEWLTSPR